MRTTRTWILAAMALAAPVACGSGGGGAADVPPETTPVEPSLTVEGLPATAPPGSALTLTVLARDGADQPAAGADVQATVTRGGGRLDAATAVTGADGRATFTWTLGPAPVVQAVSLDWDGRAATASLDGTPATPLQPAAFGDVNAFLSAQAVEGSTEDLAFTPDGTGLMLGVPGGLVRMDPAGQASTVALTGSPVGWPLGLAYDADGMLWIADANGKAVQRIDADGTVTKVPIGSPAIDLQYPNDLATGPGGLIAVADSCLGEVLVFRADGSLVSRKAFDKATEGGANGIAFDPAGDALWVTTENTGLLCMDGTDANATNGGLYRFALAPDGTLGARTDVAAGFASYADGVTFDAEGNLYVMTDQVYLDAGTLASDVWILPAGGTGLRRFLSATDKALANAAFGTAAFGTGTLYIALVAVPMLVDPGARGVVRIDVGIPGQPLVRE